MSSKSGTTVHAKTVRSPERTALVQAAKLIAEKPAMSPATALRKAGITSAAKIKRLSPALRERQAEILARGRKSASAGGGQQLKKGAKTAKTARTAKTAAALNSSRGPSKNEFISGSAIPGKTTSRPETRSPLLKTKSGNSDLMELWAEHNIRWWSELMRWSPFGVMFQVMTQKDRTPATD